MSPGGAACDPEDCSEWLPLATLCSLPGTRVALARVGRRSDRIPSRSSNPSAPLVAWPVLSGVTATVVMSPSMSVTHQYCLVGSRFRDRGPSRILPRHRRGVGTRRRRVTLSLGACVCARVFRGKADDSFCSFDLFLSLPMTAFPEMSGEADVLQMTVVDARRRE